MSVLAAYTTFPYPAVDGAAIRVTDLRDRRTGEPSAVAERRERCAEGETRVVTFTKVSRSTQDRMDFYLDGGTVDE